jgi:hypothetical protein
MAVCLLRRGNGWTVEPGKYEVIIGRHSRSMTRHYADNC